ncbi:MAG TPA: tetratricopeptide repeat protein [Desulfobacterales bacterium]|nr:tetratricopeptide repeat protein [Desulfobacterales bacterium]HIP38320.1 tetratricopeptide repeat protein [Desulfocapsa sulfexigens]
MSEQSAFNQSQVAQEAYVEPSGVLDQLNLPPGAIRFIRNNKRTLQFIAAIVVTAIVVVSLYSSYRKKRLESAASSLSISMEAEGDAKVTALEHVVSEFSGTPSALWATVELGHIAMKEKDYKKAEANYLLVRDQVSEKNPIYGLLTFGIAQAREAGQSYEEATSAYDELKKIEGYKDEGYLGMARVLEAQGQNKKALAVYEEYLGSFLGEEQNPGATRIIKEKIVRLSVQE